MPPLAICAVLLAAFTHATWNLAAKRAANCKHFIWLYSVGAFVFWMPAVIWILLQSRPEFTAAQCWVLLGTAVLHLAYSLALQQGYRVADLTVVYPVARGTGPLLSFLGALLVLGERPGTWAVCGMLLVVIGISLLSGLFRSADKMDSKGLTWGLLTGSCIAAYTVNDAYAVKVLLLQPLLVDYVGNVFRIMVLTPKVLKDKARALQEAREFIKPALTVSILGTTGYMLVLYAVQLAPLSHVAPARELATLVGTLMGAALLKETLTFTKVLGALCIVAGVVSLMLSN
ncbi:MAG: DMT family transporter [Steroidobacteraceae bacterium]